MLAAHSRLSCGPETHFFRKLSPADAQRVSSREGWPGPAVDFLASIRHTGFVAKESKALLDKYQVDAPSIAAYLRDREPSIANVLSGVTELYMLARQKQRWVEKTPDHLLHVHAIRRHFPDAPIIRIVRDPRDVAQSLTKVPWGASTFFEGVLHWERFDRSSRRFFDVDRRSCTIRFEDLVSSPVETLKTVCDFIGESFEQSMLDTSSTGAEINTRNVPWKSKVSQAVDVSRVAAWRNDLSERENQLAEALVGDRLSAFGYPREAVFNHFAELPAGVHVTKYVEALGVLARDGVRFWRSTAHERPSVQVYLGEPGSQEWSSARPHGAMIDTFKVLGSVARAAVSDHRVYWISDTDRRTWAGWMPFVVKACLSPFRVAEAPLASGPGLAGRSTHEVH